MMILDSQSTSSYLSDIHEEVAGLRSICSNAYMGERIFSCINQPNTVNGLPAAGFYISFTF